MEAAGTPDAPGPPDSPGPPDASTNDPDGGDGDPFDSRQIQMNDVSILFPLPAGYATIDAGYLPAAAIGDHGVLLPETVYDTVGHITGTTAINVVDYRAMHKDLHVVAIRIDPCFAALQPDVHGAGCTNQIRLVFQEVTTRSGMPVAFASALHAFYEISRDDLVALTRAIVALRVASRPAVRLGPLAPHPIMVDEGLDGAFATGVRALVLRYAGGDNLTRVTETTNPDAFTWFFLGFDVARDGGHDVTPIAIPTLGNSTLEGYEPTGYDPVNGSFQPSPTSPDSFVPLNFTSAALGLTAEEAQAKFTGLVRIDNPTRHSQNTIDCVSCHVATPASLWVANRLLGLSEAEHVDAYHADSRWILASDMSPTFPATPATARFNIHAFSYSDTWPGISQRTVNESAAIVAYLNDL